MLDCAKKIAFWAKLCGWGVVAGALCGCYSHRPYAWPAVEVTGAGWSSYNGQSLWKPTPHVPELAGDLFVALNTNGNAFMQFSKTLPFLTAQMDHTHWEVSIPSQKKIYSGRYPLPGHFAWLQLPALLQHQAPTSPWVFTGELTNWGVSNPHTGESLRGYLNAP